MLSPTNPSHVENLTRCFKLDSFFARHVLHGVVCCRQLVSCPRSAVQLRRCSRWFERSAPRRTSGRQVYEAVEANWMHWIWKVTNQRDVKKLLSCTSLSSNQIHSIQGKLFYPIVLALIYSNITCSFTKQLQLAWFEAALRRRMKLLMEALADR